MNYDHPDTTNILGMPFRMDCFENNCYRFAGFPLIRQNIEEKLNLSGFRLSQNTANSSFVTHGPNHFSIQGHNASVEEHTDDVNPTGRFGILPIHFKKPEEGSLLTRFDCRPVLNYINGGNKKHSKRLNLGDVLMFQPSRPHSLIFYGYSVVYLIFDVEKTV